MTTTAGATAAASTDQDLRDALLRKAAEGYDTDEEIVASVTEVLADEHPEDTALPGRIEALAGAVFEARAAEERAWPIPTDCDRLERAFAALERGGIVARQNFTCCQTCGHAEIGGEIEAARANGPVRGYAFFHMQDTERAAEGGPLLLAFGACMPPGTPEPDWDRAAVRIGQEISEALRAEGLEVRWNGELGQRISVPLTWRRRRPRA